MISAHIAQVLGHMPKTLAKDPKAVELGEWLQQQRLARGLKRPEAVQLALQHDSRAALSPDYLSKLEYGVRSLASAALDVREALRLGLNISASDWEEATGLATAQVAPELASSRPGPLVSIAPVMPFHETPITIPRELQEMVEKHGDAYPVLKTEQMQRMLAAPRNFGGAEVGPQTAEDWFDYWMANKRFLT